MKFNSQELNNIYNDQKINKIEKNIFLEYLFLIVVYIFQYIKL